MEKYMEQVIINPVKNLSIDELNTLMMAINSNFEVVKVKGKIVKDLKTKWSDLHRNCLNYAFFNHSTITKDYPKMKSRTYGDIVKIMINEECNERLKK
jgi:hypothetical protein